MALERGLIFVVLFVLNVAPRDNRGCRVGDGLPSGAQSVSASQDSLLALDQLTIGLRIVLPKSGRVNPDTARIANILSRCR